MTTRTPLSAERIVAAAVAVADSDDLAAVSMRSVARELGVEAMSLYHHVASKETLVDLMADWVFARIESPPADRPWREASARRAHSSREVLGAHPWALHLIESRPPGPSLLRHHDAVVANLLASGFTLAQAAHAFSVVDAYVYGFVLTEQNLPTAVDEDAQGFVDGIEADLGDYPHLVRLMEDQLAEGEYHYGNEFPHGLGLILDGIAAGLAPQPTATAPPARFPGAPPSG